jgi:hypothetical protein
MAIGDIDERERGIIAKGLCVGEGGFNEQPR